MDNFQQKRSDFKQTTGNETEPEIQIPKFIRSKPVKYAGIGFVILGTCYYIYQQYLRISLLIEENDLVVQINSSKESEREDAIQFILKKCKQNNNQLTMYTEKFKTQIFPILTQELISKNLKLGSSSSMLLSILITNKVYSDHFLTLNGAESLILAIQMNDPMQKGVEENLVSHLEVLFRVVNYSKINAVTKINQSSGISLLCTLFMLPETTTKTLSLVLKCLTWSAEYSSDVISVISRVEMFDSLISATKSTDHLLVKYATSLISDCSNSKILIQKCGNEILVEQLKKLLVHLPLNLTEKNNKNKNEKENENENENEKEKEKEKEKKHNQKIINEENVNIYNETLGNICLILSNVTESNKKIAKSICSDYEFRKNLINKCLKCTESKIKYCSLELLLSLARASKTNRFIIRKSPIPAQLKLLLSNEKNSNVISKTILLIKILICEQPLKRRLIIDFYTLGVIKEIPQLITRFKKNVTNLKNIVSIINAFSKGGKLVRQQLLKYNIMKKIIVIFKQTSDPQLHLKIIQTINNYIHSTKIQDQLIKNGGIKLIINQIKLNQEITLNISLQAILSFLTVNKKHQQRWERNINYLLDQNAIPILIDLLKNNKKFNNQIVEILTQFSKYPQALEELNKFQLN
ncbi:hypothetical protein M0813_07956 [Anaeramoeba flamelloides]|uniref:Uncharacterized protein n=1 Tax=Anaeramoeba flamelloides TaxID=1746091 RepID=A0ABQ8XBE1_9EUKA|nr:hypothetical protein M0813_07956 [Anaeramoeba flamelloides]